MTEQSKRMVEEVSRAGRQFQEQATRAGQAYQHQAERVGQQFQTAAENGLATALRSWEELNRGWMAMAAEANEYSKTVFNDAARTMEQLVGTKDWGDIFEIQSNYAKKAYDRHLAEVSKLGRMYADFLGNAYKQATNRA